MDRTQRRKETLLTLFPVRKSAAQKADFRNWLMAELKLCGWKAHEETYGKFNGSINVVAGDPEKAVVFLIAHYDTAPRMLVPNFISPTNPLAHIAYHFCAALLLLVLALVVSFAVSFSAALTCLSNVGPGLQEIGPVGSFAEFSSLSKVVLSVTMIAGRPEIFPILVLFSRRTWSRS